MKKVFLRSASLLTAAALTAGMMLLHNSSEYDTYFTSFRITKNGESNDYIFGRNYGFLGLSGTDISTVQDGSRIVSKWTVEDIEIT